MQSIIQLVWYRHWYQVTNKHFHVNDHDQLLIWNGVAEVDAGRWFRYSLFAWQLYLRLKIHELVTSVSPCQLSFFPIRKHKKLIELSKSIYCSFFTSAKSSYWHSENANSWCLSLKFVIFFQDLNCKLSKWVFIRLVTFFVRHEQIFRLLIWWIHTVCFIISDS